MSMRGSVNGELPSFTSAHRLISDVRADDNFVSSSESLSDTSTDIIHTQVSMFNVNSYKQ